MSNPATLHTRSSGLLLHMTSLPGPHGMGDLGPEAYRFADFLSSSGQSWWQMLPIHPPGAAYSPYATFSAFAANPWLVSLERLSEDGLLEPEDIKPSRELSSRNVRYGCVERFKEPRLEKAFESFEKRGGAERARFDAFCDANAFWLTDYSLFRVLKEMHQGRAWTRWDPDMRRREPSAMERISHGRASRVRYHQFMQYQFWRHWSDLRAYCYKLGIHLMGDVPIYVSHDSAEVWARPELFRLNPDGLPDVVAGVPPDYFSETGQLWGNPLYRWELHQDSGYEWWLNRLRLTLQRFDAVRLDHFIGFRRYWEIPGRARTAREGRWVDGPGCSFFDRAFGVLGPVQLLAEDLGCVTEEVLALRDRYEIPGMKVLQFAFGGGDENDHLPHRYPRRCAVYTGTHDNETTGSWFRRLEGRQRQFAMLYMATNGLRVHWDMIRLALASVADIAIIPVQDLLGLGAQARMNHPGTTRGNWEWRLDPGALDARLAFELGVMTETYGRKSKA